MTLLNLLKKTEFLDDEIKLILNTDIGLDKAIIDEYCLKLTDISVAENANNGLIGALINDFDGLKILKVHLLASLITYEKYKKFGICEEVFFGTIKCFSRFVKEFRILTGRIGFDRSFWTYRQLSLNLFRIGELEYEFSKTLLSEDVIAIHIPSNANLNKEKIDQSIVLAKKFFGKFFPKYSDVTYSLCSWLLSPQLDNILPKTSNIIQFKNRFDIIKTYYDDDYKLWIFGNKNLTPYEFLETTSLMRGVKKLVLSGEKFLSAVGYLRK